MIKKNPVKETASSDQKAVLNQHAANQSVTTFDEETMALMQVIKEKVPTDCDAVIILKPHNSDTPIVFTQGHPFDTTALAAQFTRQMKGNLLGELEA